MIAAAPPMIPYAARKSRRVTLRNRGRGDRASRGRPPFVRPLVRPSPFTRPLVRPTPLAKPFVRPIPLTRPFVRPSVPFTWPLPRPGPFSDRRAGELDMPRAGPETGSISGPRSRPGPRRGAPQPDGHRSESDAEDNRTDENGFQVQGTERVVGPAEERDSKDVVENGTQDEPRASDRDIEDAGVVRGPSQSGPLRRPGARPSGDGLSPWNRGSRLDEDRADFRNRFGGEGLELRLCNRLRSNDFFHDRRALTFDLGNRFGHGLGFRRRRALRL